MPGLTLDAHASQSHTQIVQHLSQQMRSRLMQAVSTATYRGEKAEVVNQFDEMTAVETNERNPDTPNLDVEKKRRWVTYSRVHWGHLIDKQDVLDSLFNPVSPINQGAIAAMHRKIDDKIIAAALGPAITGQAGTATTNFDTSNQNVAKSIGGNDTSLNVAKLRAAMKILMANEVVAGDMDAGEIYMAISAEEHDSLLGDIQATSKDFNSAPVLEQGRIMRFMGFNFIHSERLPVASNTRNCIAFAKSGLHLGVWGGITSKITERNDKSHSMQVYVEEFCGATRTEEKKVVRVQCHSA